jgi:hypothetical protein
VEVEARVDESGISGRLRLACRALRALDRRVRTLIGPGRVTYEFRTGDAELDRLVTEVRTVRSAARLLDQQARKLVEEILSRRGRSSRRDLAVLLELSHQRVHQLIVRDQEHSS